ncbi:MAG: VPLPA-CTERM sorting domain-containing protein, partial [Gammaproteobacteria bacterium]
DNGSNATVDNVAAILGVDVNDVTQINSGFSVTGIDEKMGTWEITDTSITHLAFKSNGYYILGAIDSGVTSGMWDNDPSNLGEWDLTNVQCPAEICGVTRDYTLEDFENNGGTIADLSNVRAFQVVPIPAAVWLFGSALAGLGFIKRRKMA